MSESSSINLQAFEPYNGGQGARGAVGPTSSRMAIPGLEGGQGGDKKRVVITNSNAFSIFIRMGDKDVNAMVSATVASQEILKDCQVLLKPPQIGTKAIFMAVITETLTGTASVCAGEGT